jgi:hypothetical protein
MSTFSRSRVYTGPGPVCRTLTAGFVLSAAAMLSLTACAQQSDGSGIRIIQRTPDEFCRGTARSIAVERYNMKRKGLPLAKALEQNGGVAMIDAVTRAIYSADVRSEGQAADVGTQACLRYFR